MHVDLEAPRWLWLLAVCVPAVWLVASRWPIGQGRGRWVTAILRSAVVAGLVLAVARPVRVTGEAAVSVVALIDVSASVAEPELERARGMVRALVTEAAFPNEVRLVSFATSAAEIALGDRGRPAGQGGPGAAAGAVRMARLERPPGVEALGTDISRALGFAAAIADPAKSRRVLLLSDGRATSGDTLAQAARLGTMGIPVDYLPLVGGESAADVAVDGIEAPATAVAPRATFPLRIHLVADRPTRVQLQLTRDGQPMGAHEATRTLDLGAGETEVTWPARIDEVGRPAIFAATVQSLKGRDAHPENDRAVLAIATKTAPHVLVLAVSPAPAAPLVGALRAQGMEVEVDVATDARAAGTVLQRASLDRADLVVFCDLPRAAIADGKALGALDSYVRDGGGLLVTGGAHSFGPGGWGGSRLEALLPVRLDTPQRRDEPTLALALVIDRSGSMSGPKMELTKQAARGTAEMLPVDDQIAVIAFDSQATTIVPLQRAANRLRIASDIGRIQPTGGTNILAGLREAVDQLVSARAKKKHAILLSDGQSATDGISELVDAAVGSHITISTIGVGDGVDDALLQLIARQGGGRYYHTRDPASIPRIFTRETSEVASSGIVERPTAALPTKRAALLEGVPWTAAPRLHGYVRTHARAQAELLLASDGGDPLLARWSVGLGQVVAWTSDTGSRWADSWTRWPPFAQLWGQIARGAMRARAARQFPLSARVDTGVVEVTVEAVGASDAFLSGLEGTLEITDVTADGRIIGRPGGEQPRRVPLAETAPGRYEARFAAGPPTGGPVAALLLRALLASDGRPVAVAIGQVSIPVAPELRPAVPAGSERAKESDASGGEALLQGIAAATGGHAVAAPTDVLRGAEKRRRSRPLRAPLLGALALLFVADIAVRRLSFTWSPGRRQQR